MPIVDVLLVQRDADAARSPPTQPLADALGRAFGSPPGSTWLRVRRLPASDYAENGMPVGDDERPVFVSVLHAHPPEGDARAAEARAIADAVAAWSGRDAARVHVEYAPAAAGRVAFGGRRFA